MAFLRYKNGMIESVEHIEKMTLVTLMKTLNKDLAFKVNGVFAEKDEYLSTFINKDKKEDFKRQFYMDIEFFEKDHSVYDSLPWNDDYFSGYINKYNTAGVSSDIDITLKYADATDDTRLHAWFFRLTDIRQNYLLMEVYSREKRDTLLKIIPTLTDYIVMTREVAFSFIEAASACVTDSEFFEKWKKVRNEKIGQAGRYWTTK